MKFNIGTDHDEKFYIEISRNKVWIDLNFCSSYLYVDMYDYLSILLVICNRIVINTIL